VCGVTTLVVAQHPLKERSPWAPAKRHILAEAVYVIYGIVCRFRSTLKFALNRKKGYVKRKTSGKQVNHTNLNVKQQGGEAHPTSGKKKKQKA